MEGRRPSRRIACLTALAAALMASAVPQAAEALPEAAGAQPAGFSFTPSTSEPYAACGRPAPGHSECLAVLVPSAPTVSLSASPQLAGPLGVGQPDSGGGVGGGYDPTDLRSAYNLPSASAGSGQTVAIVDAFDDPNAESDLATYRSRYGLSACTTANGCFRKVNETGGTSLPEANAGWAVEISLDVDMVSAACSNCHILLVEAKNNENANLFASEDEAVALGATEVTNSWAGKEVSNETSADPFFDHPGVPITASAGDGGYGVEYPAASQYVIAVGGTALTQASNSRGWTETAWSGTGSGCSAYEPKPSWQTDSGCAKRTNVDVSAVASPATPLSVADSYELPSEFSKPEAGWTLVGGTSASSPLLAGIMALSNAYTRSFPAADPLYKEAAQNGTGVLDDVTSGNNVKKGKANCGTYLCNAGTGYDGPTGLGSPYGAPVVLPNPPIVTTKAASSITQASATLNASVNPNSGEVSECEFEYGTSISYGSTAPCS
jgi:subtilase family serine protease